VSNDEALQRHYNETINDDEWFMEMIGQDGMPYHPTSPTTDSSIINMLRIAYMTDAGDAFLKTIKAYSEPGFFYIAQQEVDVEEERARQYEQECIDAHADMQRDIWLEEQMNREWYPDDESS